MTVHEFPCAKCDARVTAQGDSPTAAVVAHYEAEHDLGTDGDGEDPEIRTDGGTPTRRPGQRVRTYRLELLIPGWTLGAELKRTPDRVTLGVFAETPPEKRSHGTGVDIPCSWFSPGGENDDATTDDDGDSEDVEIRTDGGHLTDPPGDRDDTAEECGEPPDCVRWLDDDRAVLEIEVTRPFVEWLELEADEHDRDSVEAWAHALLQTGMGKELKRDHSVEAAVDVDLPEGVAQRVLLYYNDLQQQHGGDTSLSELLLDQLDFTFTWMLDGEPWEPTTASGERDSAPNTGGDASEGDMSPPEETDT